MAMANSDGQTSQETSVGSSPSLNDCYDAMTQLVAILNDHGDQGDQGHGDANQGLPLSPRKEKSATQKTKILQVATDMFRMMRGQSRSGDTKP